MPTTVSQPGPSPSGQPGQPMPGPPGQVPGQMAPGPQGQVVGPRPGGVKRAYDGDPGMNPGMGGAPGPQDPMMRGMRPQVATMGMRPQVQQMGMPGMGPRQQQGPGVPQGPGGMGPGAMVGPRP